MFVLSQGVLFLTTNSVILSQLFTSQCACQFECFDVLYVRNVSVQELV
jgi:hypothetical protein